MSVRGEVRYMPAEISVLPQPLLVDELQALGEETADARGGGVDEAAQAAGRRRARASPAKP